MYKNVYWLRYKMANKLRGDAVEIYPKNLLHFYYTYMSHSGANRTETKR